MKSILGALVLVGGLEGVFPANSLSQQDTTSAQLIRLTLKDGSELIGTVVRGVPDSIMFRTSGGISMTVPKDQVESIERVLGQTSRNGYVGGDPNYTRLFFAPTARALRLGQGYFSAYQIFFPFLAIGVSDFITLAGGMSLLPGAENQLFYIAPKITPVQTEKLSISGGVLFIQSTSAGSDGMGIFYGVASYGTDAASITGGLGWGFSGDETADKPIILIGGEVRASNSIKFITENWIPPDSDIALLSFGIRFFGDRLAADLGFIYPAGSRIRGFPFFPWVGFAYNFGSQ